MVSALFNTIPRPLRKCVGVLQGLMTVCCLAVHPVAADDPFPPIYDSPSEAGLAPLPAAEAAATMELPEGFTISVFASEPDVQNPIAMAWDDRGRMWVAENYTYAERSQRFDLSLRDRVLIFSDDDGDGVADQRKVFTEQVQMLTSVEVGHGGVWLMCPPQLLFIPDADQDDQPDGPARVVLDGFHVARDNYHNFANGLRFGPDGWLYGRCGHSCPGRLGTPGTADELRVPIEGGIWRYHPQTERVEVLCHGTVNPWGHDWDRNGELFFINTVIGHLWHCVPGSHFRESFGESLNPLVFERMDMIADHFHFDTRGSWHEGRDGKANDFGGGHAHIGMMIYQGDHWPLEYRNRLFTLNMHGRRANVERLERMGAGYVGKHEPDVFLSQDPFFRGIEISQGPDGNAYVLDWSDTGECHEHTGVHRHSGRIYKLSYGTSADPSPAIAKPTCLAGEGTLPRLWRDYQAGTVSQEELLELLDHEDEHLRVWAIRLLVDHCPLDTIVGPLPNAEYPVTEAILNRLAELAQHDHAGLVQLTLASTLQRIPVGDRARLAIPLVTQHQFADDRQQPYLVWYGLIPVVQQEPTAVVELLSRNSWPKLTRWISRAVAIGSSDSGEALEQLLATSVQLSEDHRQQVLEGLVEGFRGWDHYAKPTNWEAFRVKLDNNANRDALLVLDELFGDGLSSAELAAVALDKNAAIPSRQRALRSLLRLQATEIRDVCRQLIEDRRLNLLAAQGLSQLGTEADAAVIVKNYRRFIAEEQPKVIELLVSRPAFASLLLNQVGEANSQIPRLAISSSQARQIQQFKDAELDRLLAERWGQLGSSSEEKRQAITTIKAQLTSEVIAAADLARGRRLYQKLCSQCHQLFGDGQAVGPNLTGAQRSNLDYLLENILDPSATVGNEYRMSIVQTIDGRVINGLVVRRDEKVLELQTSVERMLIPVADLEDVRLTTTSAMPDGLLANLSSDEVRDLIGYLMQPNQIPLTTASPRDR